MSFQFIDIMADLYAVICVGAVSNRVTYMLPSRRRRLRKLMIKISIKYMVDLYVEIGVGAMRN